jgi:serine protease Do
MNIRILPVAVLALSIGLTASAQTKEKTPAPKTKTPKDETITIRKTIENKDKVTIVIDGDQITVNGKPVDEMKEGDIEVLRQKGLAALPRMRGRIAPMGGIKMFGGEDFPFGNSAFLGVVSTKTGQGAKISSVEKESAAEKAGLKKDDIITKIGDEKIDGSEDLYETIGKYKPEEKITISYLRDGKESTTTATLGKSKSSNMRSFNFNKDFNVDLGNELGREFNFEMPRQPGMNGMEFSYNRKPRLGLEIQDLEEGKGVKVLDVDAETPAAKAGLQKDDVISEVDGKPISSVDDLKTKVRDMKEGDAIKITYTRAGKTQSTEIKYPKKIKTAEL